MLLSKIKELGTWFTSLFEVKKEYRNVKYVCNWCGESEMVVAEIDKYSKIFDDGDIVIRNRGWVHVKFCNGYVCKYCYETHFDRAMVPFEGIRIVPKRFIVDEVYYKPVTQDE